LITIRVSTEDNTSCSFLLPINSTWVIFAGKNADGTIGFGACSKSEQIDIVYPDSLRYPRAMRNHRRSVALELTVLGYLRDAKINPVDLYQVKPRTERNVSAKFKGANITEKEFAIYRVTVDTGLAIKKIKPLKEWKDSKLKAAFLKYLETNLKLYKQDKRKQIKDSAEVTVIFYGYIAEDGNESFISEYDL
jgi:hypothetical protein